MKTPNRTDAFRFTLGSLAHLLAFSLMLFTWSAEATAPRIAAKMLGEERHVDVVGYYSSSQNTPAAEIEGKLTADLLSAAFQAGGMQPEIDVLPSKQLAKYEFVVNQVPVLICAEGDLTAKEMKRYRLVTYFLSDVANGNNPISLAFDLKNPRGDKLYKAFDKGLQKIISNGKYRELMQKHLGKDAVSANYFSRLQRQNPR
ncbi:MAG: hypothetical protein PHU06_13925 [Gallionella sp.]|nr:hypothetical protein [Gallionella sp.]MDD4960147.1 hypothetical protein [Gallionella sp.]